MQGGWWWAGAEFTALVQVEHGHARGLQVGWYENGCKCAEKQDDPLNYHGDIASLHDFGFVSHRPVIPAALASSDASARRRRMA